MKQSLGEKNQPYNYALLAESSSKLAA